MEFTRHEIGRAGNKMGQTSLVDVDRDGDLDWVVGCRSGTVWWFEHQRPDRWIRHTIGEKAGTDVGGDGDIDICSKPWNGDLHVYLENVSP